MQDAFSRSFVSKLCALPDLSVSSFAGAIPIFSGSLRGSVLLVLLDSMQYRAIAKIVLWVFVWVVQVHASAPGKIGTTNYQDKLGENE